MGSAHYCLKINLLLTIFSNLGFFSQAGPFDEARDARAAGLKKLAAAQEAF
jgi:hypothetical protein